jgi:peptidoglycan/LPS O-acetylase OafA/YrhL
MQIKYRPEIDGLRAIAVISVILYHSQISIFGYQIFAGGFIGVDLFFVISGYLITYIILNELITTGKFSLKNFYERRVRRILPVLLLVMTVSLAFAWIYLLPDSLLDFSKSILYSLSFSSNFYFWHSGEAYGAQSSLLKPFLHTWSLSIEEQFYIIFPIIILTIFKYFRKNFFLILILIFTISIVFADWSSRNYPSFSFYILPTRIWELLSGFIVAYFEIKFGHRSKNQMLIRILPSTGLLLIGYSLWFFNDKIFHPSFYTITPIIGICLIIWFSDKNELITKIISSKLFVSIGLISYSLYIWHYPIFAFARYTEFVQQNMYKKIFLAIIILVLSIFSYYFLERVARNKKYQFKFVFFFIFLFSTFLIFASSIIVLKDGFKTRMPEILNNFYNYSNVNYLKNENNQICYESITKKEDCVFNSLSNKKVFMIGDSHMGKLMFDFKDKIVNKNYQFRPYILGSCPYFIGFDRVIKNTKKIDQNCNNKYFSKIDTNLKDAPNSIIIFGGRLPFYLNNKKNWDQEFIPTSQTEFTTIETSFRTSLIELSRKNNIILIYPIPEIGFNVPKKIFFSNKKNVNIPSINYKKYAESSFKLLNSIKGSNIYRVYPHKIFCDYLIKDSCVTHNNNDIFYIDDQHISIKGAEIINNLIIKEIDKIEKITKDSNLIAK